MTLIAQLTDLHLRPRGMAALRVSETNMFAACAVDRLSRMTPRPDAVLITGDLSDTGTASEYEMAKELLDRLPMPWFAIPGNHDSSSQMRTTFGDRDWAVQSSCDGLQFTVWIGDLAVIGVDTSVPGKAWGRLETDQLADLADRLVKTADHPTIVALHHPPIPTGIAHMDRTMLRNPAELAEVLQSADHIVRVLCGHQHRPVTATFANKTLMIGPGPAHQVGLDLIPDGIAGFNFEPPAFLLHRWTSDIGLVSHMGYVQTFPGPFPFWHDPEMKWPGYN